MFVDPIRQVRRLGFQPCQNLLATPEGFSLRLSFFTVGRRLPEAECPGSTVLMAEKPSPVRCAECQQLWKDYGDASLKRVRAYGNLKLANPRSDSETMEMLAEALATATERLEEVKKRIQEHDARRHAFQQPTH